MVKEKDTTFSLLFSLKHLFRSRSEVSGTMSMAQLEALRYVAEEKQPTMQALARHQGVTAPSATALAEELVAAGYLTRIRNGHDRRQVRLSLTKEGTSALRRSMAAQKEIVEQIFGSLDDHDHAEFNRILKYIINTQVY